MSRLDGRCGSLVTCQPSEFFEPPLGLVPQPVDLRGSFWMNRPFADAVADFDLFAILLGGAHFVLGPAE
jgi:hypothetical protein